MKTCFNVRRDPERSDDMGNRKARTSAKPHSATKARSKVKRAKPIVRHNSRAKSKQAAVVALLNRPQGDAPHARLHLGCSPSKAREYFS
jgi:hypothetical protein